MGPKILHRPGLIRPTGSQGQSRIFGPIGSIYQSIADTRYIIVVKLIKSVIAYPADRKEGLRPVRSPKSFSEAPSPSTISFYVNSEYNSSEIDKIRYCQSNRQKGGPTARVTTCPENLHRPGQRPLSLPYNKEIISNTCCRMQKKTPGKNRLLVLPRRGQTRPTEDFCQVSFTCIQNNVLEIIFCYSHQTIYHRFFGMCRLL